jgi:hypothetical protein
MYFSYFRRFMGKGAAEIPVIFVVSFTNMF